MAEADAISRLNAWLGVDVKGSSIVEPAGFASMFSSSLHSNLQLCQLGGLNLFTDVTTRSTK